jgi:hypothetical protein
MSSTSNHLCSNCRCVSVKEIDYKLPANIVVCADGTVREICDDGCEILIHPEYNANGTAFLKFEKDGPADERVLWVARAMYKAHCGPISSNEYVIHIDGDRRNLHPSNLRVAPKPTDEYRLVRRNRPVHGTDFLD